MTWLEPIQSDVHTTILLACGCFVFLRDAEEVVAANDAETGRSIEILRRCPLDGESRVIAIVRNEGGAHFAIEPQPHNG